MVQEWQYEEKDRPQHSIDEFGRIRMQCEEPVENLVTWVYEEGVAQLLEALTEAQGDFDSEVVQSVLKRTL